MRIFLSYGHDNNTWLVERIKHDLEMPEHGGHDVWIDSSEIKFGNDWRRSITDGITESEVVFSFLSQHSVRDPGVCLDELAIAIGVKGGLVHSILLEHPETVDVPVTISHMQWLDMHECNAVRQLGEDAFNEWYVSKFEEIKAILIDPTNKRFAGEIGELEKNLNPISTAGEISRQLNNGFVGREWLFAKLEAWRKNDSKQRVFCITGEPGIGKSAIAASLAHNSKHHVIGINFCRYDQPDSTNTSRIIRTLAFQIATRLSDYRKFLQNRIQLMLREKSLPEYAPAELFRELISASAHFCIDGNRERYLVVIDGLDESGTDLARFLAEQKEGLPRWLNFVITSRPNEANVMAHLSVLYPHFLSAENENNQNDIRKYIKYWLNGKNLTDSEQNRIIEPLVKASGGNFLYVTVFRKMVEESENGANFLNCPSAYPQGLTSFYYTYFQRKFADIYEYEEKQASLLRLLTSSRSAIPVEVIKEILDLDDEYLRKKLIRPFGSLLKQENGTLMLFHKSIGEWLNDEEKSLEYYVDVNIGRFMLAEYVWKKLNAACDDGNDINDYVKQDGPICFLELNSKHLHKIIIGAPEWNKIRNFFANSARIFQNLFDWKRAEDWSHSLLFIDEEILGTEHLDTSASLDSLAVLFQLQAKYNESLPLYERALKIRENKLGMEHIYTSNSLNNLASLFFEIGNFDKALPFYEQALAILEKKQEPENTDIAACINNIARILQVQGKYHKALSLLERALLIEEKSHVNGSNNIARICNNIGNLHFEMGNGNSALPFFEKALAIMEKSQEPAHPEKATSLNGLAILLKAKGDYDKALPLYQQALAILEDSLGPNHPDTASSLNNLALLLYAQGYTEKALPLLERDLSICEKSKGLEHLDTANSLSNFARLLQAQGEFCKALPLLERALTIREKSLGREHLETVRSLINLASLFQAQGTYDKAIVLYERALATLNKLYSEQKTDKALCLNHLASLFQDRRNFSKALSLYEQALAILENSVGTGHPETVDTLCHLASLYQNQGKYEKALKIYEKAFISIRASHDNENLNTVRMLNNIANVFQHQGKYDKALPLYERALEIRERLLGFEHPDTARSANNLATVLQHKKKYDEALPLYERALKIREEKLGLNHTDTATTLYNLATLFITQGSFDMALPLLGRALAVWQKTLGMEHPNTSSTLNYLLVGLPKLNNNNVAQTLYTQIIEMLLEVSCEAGKHHPEIGLAISGYTALLTKMGQGKSQIKDKITVLMPEYLITDAPSALIEQNLKIGRNDPCTCGSSKKYKKCCGA